MARRNWMLLAVLLSVLLVAAACGPAAENDDDAVENGDGEEAAVGIVVADAWARPAGAGHHSAAYMVIENTGTADDAVIDADAPVGNTELHESVDEDGIHRMIHVDTIPLPAGGKVVLEPAGLHIMLMDLEEELEVGDTFTLTLFFESGHEENVTVNVQGSELDHDDHDH